MLQATCACLDHFQFTETKKTSNRQKVGLTGPIWSITVLCNTAYNKRAKTEGKRDQLDIVVVAWVITIIYNI
jgi:hypothetical protein